MSNLAIYEDSSALAGFEDYASGMAKPNVQYLKFAKGEFIYGLENVNVEPEERFAANMETLKKGYICWGKKQVLGEEMAPAHSKHKVNLNDLPEHPGGEWAEQHSIEFVNVDNNEVLLFKTSSWGGRSALGALTNEFLDRIKSGKKDVVPVIEMHSTHYDHKDYGKVYTPKFEIVDWLYPAGMEEDDSDAVEGEVIEEPKPAKRKRRVAL